MPNSRPSWLDQLSARGFGLYEIIRIGNYLFFTRLRLGRKFTKYRKSSSRFTAFFAIYRVFSKLWLQNVKLLLKFIIFWIFFITIIFFQEIFEPIFRKRPGCLPGVSGPGLFVRLVSFFLCPPGISHNPKLVKLMGPILEFSLKKTALVHNTKIPIAGMTHSYVICNMTYNDLN